MDEWYQFKVGSHFDTTMFGSSDTVCPTCVYTLRLCFFTISYVLDHFHRSIVEMKFPNKAISNIQSLEVKIQIEK